MNPDEITVVIAVWDAYCSLLLRCVASVREQAGAHAALVVVDNASEVELPPLDGGVTVVRAPRRLSAGAARNLGLAQVSSPLVLFLDADDVLLPGALERLEGMLTRRPDAVAAVCKHRLWDPETGAHKVIATSPRPLVRRISRHRRLFALLTLRFDCYPLVGCALIRTGAARDAGGFGDATLGEDWMLRSALAFRGRVIFSDAPVVRVRVSTGSLWRRGHSRRQLERMYQEFRARTLSDPALPRWARLLMPAIARGHRRDVVRRTRAGAFTPSNHGLSARRPAAGHLLRLSVIVCTHDRPERLAACLDALGTCDATAQVVVVDSGSSISCEEVVDRHGAGIADLRYVQVIEPGLSRARNAGVSCSDGDLVAFVDDDATPLPGWDRALVEAFRRQPDVGCVGGACIAQFTGRRPRWLSDRLLALSSITRFGGRPREPRSSAEWPFGANMAFRRDALADAGEFCEELGRTGDTLLSGEDSDMVRRVLAAGWRVWLEPRAAVFHAVHTERLHSRFYWRRLWWAGIGRATQPALRTTVRLLGALPVRVVLWAATGDRIYLYRLAETAGYLAARCGLVTVAPRR